MTADAPAFTAVHASSAARIPFTAIGPPQSSATHSRSDQLSFGSNWLLMKFNSVEPGSARWPATFARFTGRRTRLFHHQRAWREKARLLVKLTSRGIVITLRLQRLTFSGTGPAFHSS